MMCLRQSVRRVKWSPYPYLNITTFFALHLSFCLLYPINAEPASILAQEWGTPMTSFMDPMALSTTVQSVAMSAERSFVGSLSAMEGIWVGCRV